MISIRASRVIGAVALFATPWLLSQSGAAARPAGQLKPKHTVERVLAPRQTDEYTVNVKAGQFVRLVAQQLGVDVTVTVLNPLGKPVVEADRPNGAYGPEAVSFIGEMAGRYRVRVSSGAEPGGRYRMESVEVRPPTESDRSRIEAERIEFQVPHGAAANSQEAQARSIELYEHAVSLWRQVADAYEEGLCLNAIGIGYSALGDRQKALEYYNRALSVRHAAGDQPGEASTLFNLGSTYAALGEKQKSLDAFRQALPLTQAVGDRFNEANVLRNIAQAYSALGEKQKSLDAYLQAIPLLHALANRSVEANTLYNTGTLYFGLGDKQKALDYGLQALAMVRAIGERAGEPFILGSIALDYSALGQKQKALDCYGQALALYRAAGNRPAEGTTINDTGMVYAELGDRRKALDDYNEALAIHRAVGNRAGEAISLNNIGGVYHETGEEQKALEYYNQALQLRRAVGDRFGEAATLNNIGSGYSALGEKQKAIDYYGQALPLIRAVGDRSGEGRTLNNLGAVYQDLGDKQKALEYYNQALATHRASGDLSGVATTLNNLGGVYFELGEKQKALDYYNESLPLRRTVGDRAGEATSLANIGVAYYALGEKEKALDYYGQSLPIRRAVGDRFGEAATLNSFGQVYAALGERAKALESYGQAISLRHTIGDRAGEAATLKNVSALFEKAQPEAAILFAKQAVNLLQTLRRDNLGLDDSLRRSFEKSIESHYRYLAGLLVDRERFGEAEEVLNLLKDKEAADFIRRDAVADQLKPATLLDSERQALDRYEQILTRIVAEGESKSALVAKAATAPLSAEESQQAQQLDQDLSAANTVLLRFFDEEEKSFAVNSASMKRVGELRESEGLQDVLQALGPDVVAIYTLVLPDKYTALLVTSGARKAYSTEIAEADLNRKIFDFRQQLQNPASNPLPLAQELYRILFPEGLRDDLDRMGAKTIMWSIDSTIRYVPIAALHDGRQYLVTHFRNSLITPASLARLTEASQTLWRGAGFGVSQAEGNFSALPGVPEELHRIFRQGEGGNAPVAGRVELDGEFTRAAFEAAMRQPDKAVIHIATHFDSQPGVAANSRLLLGDGTEMSLAEIEAQPRLFSGVDLLTLSACSTAFTNRSEDGREVDSFGTIAQRLGAKGVIASLWSVSDEATARLMESMYRIRQAKPELGKSEALRQAQEQMASGVLTAAGSPVERGVHVAGANSAAGWTHPYYWAPFILIGNWK